MLKQYLANIYLKIKKYIFLLPAKKEDYFIEHYIFFHLICWLQLIKLIFKVLIKIKTSNNFFYKDLKEYSYQNINQSYNKYKSSKNQSITIYLISIN